MEVYHLKNWGFLRDMMCAFPDETEMLISDTLKEMEFGGVKERIKEMVKDCSCPGTKEGFETCLVRWREDISVAFRGSGEKPEFETFLNKLDDTLKKEIETFYEKHIL